MDILFVCTGNTCRSAMAEWLTKKAVYEKKLEGIKVYSCGINTLPSFRVPPIVVSLMAKEGVDMHAHRATQITRQIVAASDLILVMAGEHKDFINSYFPEASGKTHLFKVYLGGIGEIEDPIGHKDEVYIKTEQELKDCVTKLLDKLKKENIV
jgi:protein-tyrosine-phosphatase